MMEHAKDLPPLTLSNTSVSGLVTLIPMLLSMTSHGETPSYDDETGKPAWWPSDVKWRNPKFYIQDEKKQQDSLKVLRKLVYSCYLYHGVEDLLFRLEETPFSDCESGENMDIIQLADDSEEVIEDSSAESEGPVFVCCFCLDQFNSHELVNVHQNICSKRLNEISHKNHFKQTADNSNLKANTKPQHPNKGLAEPYAALGKTSAFPLDNACNEITSSSSESSESNHLPRAPAVKSVKATVAQNYISSNKQSRLSNLSSSSTASSNRRQAAITIPFVPTLKTRSQRKLEQIMEKHKMRHLMLKECREMKDVPRSGAWWTRRRNRKLSFTAQHPRTCLTADTFMQVLGLARVTDVAALVNKDTKQEVDLDCEIISVEGPLSAIPPPAVPLVVEKPTSASPRSTRLLISQLGRSHEINTRRRLSFCFVEDEWADREAFNEGRDPLQMSLLTLDLSSPLGQRIRKYVKGEGHLNIIKDIEGYCRTELDEDGYSKLRYREYDFRVTFKKKKRSTHYVHKYKFNKRDNLEFKRLLKTGLNAYSRHLKHGLRDCKVVVTKMSESEIKSLTQERKITIPEEIVYDDDICITHIDIPTSMMSKGVIPDTHSPPHPHSYRQNHLFPSSSPLPVARLNATSDTRSIFSPRISSSPPHIPNIFRSRTSHTPSPPRPGNVHRPPNVPSSLKPHNFIDKSKKNIREEEHFRNCSSSLPERNTSQHRISDSSNQNLTHLSGHACLSPSTYNLSGQQASDARSSGDLSNTINRRKQQLTQVRRDDGVSIESNKPVISNRVNLHRKGLMENRNMDTLYKNEEHFSKGSGNQALPPPPAPTRKLSNFDYFSIRDGKIQPGCPKFSHPLLTPHRNVTTASPHNQQHSLSLQNTHQLRQDFQQQRQNSHQTGQNSFHPRQDLHQPKHDSHSHQLRHNFYQSRQDPHQQRQNPHQPQQDPDQTEQNFHHQRQDSWLPIQNHHTRSLSSTTSQPHQNNIRSAQPIPCQSKPSAITGYNHPQQNHSLPSKNALKETFTVNQYGINSQRPELLKNINPNIPSQEHSCKNVLSDDDDVLEVICIDDD